MANLVSAAALRDALDDPALRLVDTRFDLADPAAGRRAYESGHLPGAVHLDLDADLSAPAPPGAAGGRHPLPPLDAFRRRLAALGIGDEHRVVAYDDRGGAFAGRLWWMLRYLGHDAVALLDGGLQAWEQAGYPLEQTTPAHAPSRFGGAPRPAMMIDHDELAARLARPGLALIDARAAARYRGDSEPLDLVAGHIPGARSRPFADNLADGRFLAADVLRDRYADVADADEVVVYCGSGVTACHDILAIEEAGLPLPRLYLGSWSDWCSRPGAPVATGDEV